MEDSKNADEEEEDEGSVQEEEEEAKKGGWDEEEEEWKELQDSVKRDRDSQKGSVSESPVVHAPFYPTVSPFLSVGRLFSRETHTHTQHTHTHTHTYTHTCRRNRNNGGCM